MGFRGAFVTGTVLSFSVTAAWSYTAVLTTGPVPALHLGRRFGSDYAQLANAATGSGIALFAVTALIYTACFFASGLRARRKAQREAGRESDYYAEDTETIPVSGRRA